MVTRWINIGTLRTGWYVWLRNWGCPNGFYMAWRGRVSWSQPTEFIHWRDVMNAIEYRLKMAGLELLAIASEVPSKLCVLRWRDCKVLVQVCRLRK